VRSLIQMIQTPRLPPLHLPGEGRDLFLPWARALPV